MKSLTKNLAVATVAAAAFILPTAAHAGDYRKCKDTEAAVAGGLIGGSLGTIIGEEIAGRGDKTEGAIAGALIGGVIGAAIGDGASDCEKDGRIYRNGRAIGTQTSHNGYRTVDHRYNSRNRGHYSRGYQYNHRDHYDRGRDRSYGYTAYEHDRDLRRIDYRTKELESEYRRLKDRRRYDHNPWIDRRLREISYEIDRLKDERKRLKRLWDDSRRHNSRSYTQRRGHYHGRTLCYSDH